MYKDEIRKRIEMVTKQYIAKPHFSSLGALKYRFINWGLKNKEFIKKIPILSRVSEKIYMNLIYRQRITKENPLIKTVKGIPILSIPIIWVYRLIKLPTRFYVLSEQFKVVLSEIEEIKNKLLSLSPKGVRVQAFEYDTAPLCAEIPKISEVLALGESFKGPRAREGLWFNDPVLIEYNEEGRPLWCGTTERIIENAWVFCHLSDVPQNGRILDVGCSESVMSVELASNGFQVTGIDVHPYPLKHPNFQFIQGDICYSDMESKSYDAVIALSTIEHIGLGWYGDPCGASRDYSAMKQIYRLLKPNGRLLVTVPFGQYACTPLHRIYDGESLRALLHNFEIKKIEYGVRVDNKTWVSPVTEENASQQRHDCVSNAPSAVAMILCIKPE